MESNQFWIQASTLLTLPLYSLYLMVLIDRWRYSPKYTRLTLLFSLLAVEAMVALILVTHATTPVLAKFMGNSCVGLATAGIFLYLSPWRKGKLLFIFATACVYFNLPNAWVEMLGLEYGPIRYGVKVLMNIALVLLLYFFFRPSFHRVLVSQPRIWYQMSLLPIVLCVNLSLLLVHRFFPPVRPWLNLLQVVFSLVVLCSFAVFFIMLHLMDQDYRRSRENTLLSAQITALHRSEGMELLQLANRQSMDKERTQFITQSKALLDQGEIAQVQQLIAALGGKLHTPGTTSLHSFTGDALLDAVLSDYKARCAKNSIAFFVSLALPSWYGPPFSGLAVALSNGLENAFHACCELPAQQPRSISLKGGSIKDAFFLHISNSFLPTHAPVMDPKTGLPQSRQEGHGYGTRSILAFAQAHGGFLEYQVQENQLLLRMLIYPISRQGEEEENPAAEAQ